MYYTEHFNPLSIDKRSERLLFLVVARHRLLQWEAGTTCKTPLEMEIHLLVSKKFPPHEHHGSVLFRRSRS